MEVESEMTWDKSFLSHHNCEQSGSILVRLPGRAMELVALNRVVMGEPLFRSWDLVSLALFKRSPFQ